MTLLEDGKARIIYHKDLLVTQKIKVLVITFRLLREYLQHKGHVGLSQVYKITYCSLHVLMCGSQFNAYIHIDTYKYIPI